MTIYHISPDTGNPNVCRAQPGKCRFGANYGHYTSKEEARAAFESSMSQQGHDYADMVNSDTMVTMNTHQHGINPPTTPAEALHVIALVAQGHTLTDKSREAARSFDISVLTPEQNWGTWNQVALSESPSKGLQALHELGFEDNYPELSAVRGVPQDPVWHPEGSVEKHIQEAGDVAASISKEQGLSDTDTAVAVLGAICHDFGKATHTQIDSETGKITSHGHAGSGRKPARKFLERIGADETIVQQVPVIVGEHMCHINEPNPNSAFRLNKRLNEGGTTMEAWSRVADSDVGGRGAGSGAPVSGEWLAARDKGVAADERKNRSKSGFVNGDMLRELGHQPGPHFGDMLRGANAAYADGEFTDLTGAREWLRERYPVE